MRYLLLIAYLFFTTMSISAQDKPAYLLFNKKGKKTKYKKLQKACSKADIVLFGELHNNPIGHWLQLELATDLQKTRDLVVGLEMLETDNQEAIDKYLINEIDASQLDSMARLCLLYTSPSPRDATLSRMPSSA